MYATHLSNWKGWSQDPPLHRPHLRVGSGDEGISLESPAYWRSSKGKQFFFCFFLLVCLFFGCLFVCFSFLFCFCVYSCCVWAYPHFLQLRTLLFQYYCYAFYCIMVLLLSCSLYVLPFVPRISRTFASASCRVAVCEITVTSLSSDVVSFLTRAQ